MSKFVEAMDAFVRLVVLTVFTTGALQFSGVVHSPGHTVSAYPQFRVGEFHELYSPEGLTSELSRIKRDEHAANKTTTFLEDIFNIPISTLHAVNKLVQNSQPALQRLHEAAQKRRLENGQVDNERTPRTHRTRRRHFKNQLDKTETKMDETTSVVIKELVTV